MANDFVFDDRFVVVDNPLLAEPASWGRLFLESSWSGVGFDARTYRPLPMVSFGINRLVGGLDPAGYHLVNVGVHALAALLLFALGRALGLGLGAAGLAAALFAVHPLQTEPVAEIVGRMDLMAGAAFLGALLAHLRLRERQRRGLGGAPPALAALALYTAGLLSKEHVFLLPAVAATWDLLARPVPVRQALRIHAGYLALAGGYLLVRGAAFGGELLAGSVSRLDNPLAHVDAPLRVVSALAVAGRYLRHVAVPVDLSPDYCYAQVLPLASFASPAALVALTVTVAAVVAALALARRSAPAGLALALGAAAFLPVSNLLFPIGTVMGDRLFYLPLAGLALLAGLGWQRAGLGRRRVAWAAAALVLAAAATLSFRQARHWRSDLTLDRQAVRAAPRCARAHSNLGYDLLELGDFAAATREFETALSIFPPLPKAEVGLAIVAADAPGATDLGRAEHHLERALGLDPSSRAALDLAADIARRRGDEESARRLWQRRLELDPEHPQALSNLAILEWSAGRRASALELWRRAVASPRAPADVWRNFGRALAALGRDDEAKSAMRRAEAAPRGEPRR